MTDHLTITPDEMVRELREAGMSVRSIANRTDMSETLVRDMMAGKAIYMPIKSAVPLRSVWLIHGRPVLLEKRQGDCDVQIDYESLEQIRDLEHTLELERRSEQMRERLTTIAPIPPHIPPVPAPSVWQRVRSWFA